MIEQEVREIAARQMPYFRDRSYTMVVSEVTENAKYLFQTSRTPLTLTASGSGVMEMAILNLLNPGDEVVVLNCGTFGKKWATMCQAFGVCVKEVVVPWGKTPDLDQLSDSMDSNVKALLMTAHETSTGLLNDTEAIGKITCEKDILLIVDAVSSIGADEFRMDDWHCDCSIVSSQKALACQPGISFIVFSEKAWAVVPSVKQRRYYFDAEEYLRNVPRGMLPYTPAINVTYQLDYRLKQIRTMGLQNYQARHQCVAGMFREKLLSTGLFTLFAERQSNALTSFKLPAHCTMRGVIDYIKDKYAWFIAPNPTGDQTYLRVSHMGAIPESDTLLLVDRLVEATEHFSGSHGQPVFG